MLPADMLPDFLQFLLDAKRNTYAAQGDAASVTPLLPGSRQLEYRQEPFLYRDIYLGMAFFVGQETIYYQDQPIWAMSYAGGVMPQITAPTEISAIYRFLRAALRQVSLERPYRGPATWTEDTYRYSDDNQGSVERFWGYESILRSTENVYALHYSGGFLR